jgi:hypothetical protein
MGRKLLKPFLQMDDSMKMALLKEYAILWNSNFHYCAQKIPSLAFVPSQMNPVHALSSYFYKSSFNIVVLSTTSSS